jgi:hypothetical protein
MKARLTNNLIKIIVRWWRKLGVLLFGGFFQKLYQLKAIRANKIKMQQAAMHRMKKQGLRVYDIGGIKVVAHNQKNAERKAKAIRAKI